MKIFIYSTLMFFTLVSVGCFDLKGNNDATSKIKLVPVVLETQVVDTTVGNGEPAKNQDQVIIKFEIWTYDPNKHLGQGKLIEKNQEEKLFKLQIGRRTILPAWEDALIGMKPGGKRSILLPPDLAYGKSGIKNLVKSSTPLLIHVELVKIVR